MRWLGRVRAVVALALIVLFAPLALSAQDSAVRLLVYDAWLVRDAGTSDAPASALLYLTIENAGNGAATLTAIETPDLDAQIVIDGDGEALVIEPDAIAQLAPDETPVRMVMQGDAPLPETGVLLRLIFTTAHDATVKVDSSALWTDAAPEAEDMIAYGGWARPTALEAGEDADAGAVIGGAYLTLENRGDEADTLVGVTSPRAGIIELHETQVTNDIARMRPVDEIALEAGAQVHLEPGGLHLMLLHLPEHLLPGDVLPLTLHFESGRELTVGLTVRDERAETESHTHSH